MGTVVSSLHRLKDSDNKEGAFFIFGDLSVRLEGQFALQFNLYEMRDNLAAHVRSIISEKFTVQGPKVFPGLSESTPLTRSFSEQGVRLRVRKEPRLLLRKNGPSDAKYVPRTYKRSQQMKEEESEEVLGSPESSRHSQVEQHGSMQSPLEGPHAQQMGLVGSYPGSQQSTGTYDSYSQEHIAKRPRTGSEHSQLSYHGQQSAFAQQSQQMAPFGQQRSAPMVTPPAYVDDKYRKKGSNNQQSYASYPQPSPQGMYGGHQYSFSPNTFRGGYFPPQFNTQQGIESPSYEQPPQTHYPPQPQAQYQHLPGYGGQPSPSLQHYGMVDDGSRQPGMSQAEMGHPQYGRMTSGAGYGTMMGNQGDRRSGFVVPVQHGFSQLGQTVSAGSMARSPGVPITTGPGPMDNTYQ